MSVAIVLLIAAVACCALLLGIMLGCDFFTYRRGRGAMLFVGLVSVIVSVTQFYSARRASARHSTVVSHYWGAPITPGQDYFASALLLPFGATCIVLSLRRAARDRDPPNV
jgi:putative Mn2+ efflux pump MntP